MKLGLTIKPFEWNDQHLALCRQLGCESVVAWMPLPAGDGVWHTDDLAGLKNQANAHGLELAAIENLPPAHWDHVLLGEEGREAQIANIGRTIRNMGKVGIPCLGYDSVGFEGLLVPDHTPTVSAEHSRETGMAYALGYMRTCMQAISSHQRSGVS